MMYNSYCKDDNMMEEVSEMSHEHEHDHEYMHEHNIPHDHHDHDMEHPHQGAGDHPHEHSHEHMHEHTHEHTHADGTTHSHEHAHTHEHGHEHPAACPGAANCASGSCEGCSADPRAEVIALMQYMVNHNAAHANELATLAKRLQEMGDNTAFEQVMQAVSDFEKGNMRLSTVLAALNIPQK